MSPTDAMSAVSFSKSSAVAVPSGDIEANSLAAGSPDFRGFASFKTI